MNVHSALEQMAFRVARPDAVANMREVERLSLTTKRNLEEYQKQRLSAVLRHASETVPYYEQVLDGIDISSNGEIQFDRFTEIPILTKDELRSEDLQSTERFAGTFANTSGGTTGEPVEFLQDDQYLAWNNANRRLYQQLAGREPGEPWVKLWGDENEISEGYNGVKDRLSNFVLNRHVLNAYRMGESDMREHIASINAIQPATIEAYVESIYELAKFVRRNDLRVHSPNGILSTAGTLTETMRTVIEEAFDTTVLDKYGSREVGTVACECPRQEGLHVFSHTHYVEIVDDGDPVAPGEEGKLAITLLTNYTMPLIRYEIGDMAVKSQSECSCDLPFPTIESVTGRVTDHFVTTDGELVYPGYLRKLLYHESWVRKYQIVQTDQDRVVYRFVLTDGEPDPGRLDEITAKTRSLLGEETTVEIEYVDGIEPFKSGKFRYTISEVENE